MTAEEFKATYTPDSSKWSRTQTAFYNESVRAAYLDGFDKGKDKACVNPGTLLGGTAQECGCRHCSAALASAEKQKELTGYDWKSEKPTRS